MASDVFRDCSLGDLADLRNGKALPTEKYSDGGKYPVFGANGQIARTDEVLNEASVVVIGRVGALCGNVHEVYCSSWITDNALVLAVKESDDAR